MSDSLLIFSGASYVATGLSVATAIAAAITLAIGIAILVRSRDSATATVFFLLTFVASGWLLSYSMMYAAQMPEVASFFHHLESSNELLRVEKYDIQPKNKESSIARCSMTVSKTVLGVKRI